MRHADSPFTFTLPYSRTVPLTVDDDRREEEKKRQGCAYIFYEILRNLLARIVE